MKRHLLILIALCFPLFLSAQTPAKFLIVKGIAVDSVGNKPLELVTVALLNPQTKVPVKGVLSAEDGTFEISAPAGKKYDLALAFVGYNTKTISLTDTIGSKDVGKLILSASNKTLNEVKITGLKPLVKREVDRIGYDVQADAEVKSITALDMMRKVPLLSVDANDNIKLRGSGSYKILINNKESALMARNPTDILKAMPAANILRIEVITTPPAKYDAEGLAGIINIITKKDADQGYNGSINTGYNTVWGYRANLNLTVKQGKFGYSGYTGFGGRKARSSRFENENTFFDSTKNVSGKLFQNGIRTNGNNNKYTESELSFEMDSLNLLTGTINWYKGDNTQGNIQSTLQRNKTNDIIQEYNTTNNGNGSYEGSDLGLNYQKSFKRSKDQLLTLSYKYSSSSNQQFNNLLTNGGKGAPADYRQDNNSGTKEHTAQLDYVHPVKKLIIEAGGKLILRDNYSNYTMDTLKNGNYVIANDQTNIFTYQQNVYSTYNSYHLKLKKWAFKAGLRFEGTTVKSSALNLDKTYNNLVPSFSAQRTLDSVSSLTFGFTQRIQRPGIYQLNPFINKSNPLFISTGNPNLTPAVNNNFELAYSISGKGSINVSSFYTFANNTIENISTLNTTNNVTTNTYANVGKNRRLGASLDINYPITKKFTLNVNATLLQVWLEGYVNGELIKNSGQQGYIFTYYSYKFDKGTRVGLNIGFDSRYVLLQGRDNYWFNNAYSVSQDLFKGKLNVSFSANNPFKEFIKLDFFTQTSQFQTYNVNYNFYRTFNFGLNYKFGALNSSIKKNQRGISNDDTSSGRSSN